MTDDEKKTDEKKAVEAVVKDGPPVVHKRTLRDKVRIDVPNTITSVAETSAELFRPDQAELIKGYMQSLKQAEKGHVFALAEGKIAPGDVGIETPLESDVTQTYAKFELGERESKGNRLHDVGKIALGAVVMLLVWLLKEYTSAS